MILILYWPSFLLILILAFIYILPSIIDFGRGSSSSFEVFITNLWKDNEAIKSGEYYRMLTSIFIHADLSHILFNCLGVFFFNDLLVNLYLNFGIALGPFIYFCIFILGGIMGNILSLIFSPNPGLGASGGVFAFVGYLFYVTGFNFNIFVYIVVSFILSSIPGKKIDNFAHLGGLIAGLLVAIGLTL